MLSKYRSLPKLFANAKRSLHEISRYIFVQDHKYDLLKKMKEKSVNIPQVDPLNGLPSSFARNLLHPFSKHIVSQYAAQYYQKAKPYYGEYAIQFFGSDIYPNSVKDSSESMLPVESSHSIIIYPDQIKINNIEVAHIPHILRLCEEDNETLLEQVKYDYRMEKMEKISIYFFCDISSLDRTFMLFQWFDLCFRRSNYHDINYVFSSGNMKNDQSSTIIIHNGDYRLILSQFLTLKEVDEVVQHMISWE